MPLPLLSCIPNLSEGRNLSALSDLDLQLQAISGLHCLDWSADADHHRSVWTLAGAPQALTSAVHTLFSWANQHIDLRQHQGVHPRIGAVDVIPLVPLQGISLAEARAFAETLAGEVVSRWQVPLYLYAQSARRVEHQHLPSLRQGGFEALSQRLREDPWQPDLGPLSPHPRLGASVLGIRRPLIAWNVWLNSPDLALARAIAREIRERDGGFPALRALGLYLPTHHQVQISMNLLDHTQSSLYAIFSRIEELAAAAGITVMGTELIGLVPARALGAGNPEQLRLFPGHTARILEARLGLPNLD
ncbi:MAG: glutamate formimidoyltransferase [Candidatus Sericytochromatia bacterium]